MDSLDKPKILVVDYQARATRKLMEYMQAYGRVLREDRISTSDFQIISITPDEFTKSVPISYGTNFDHIIFDEVPECSTHAEEDNPRSKDNFRPASDWNYLQLRKKKW